MPAPFALALLALDGVGRVTAHRVLERFPTLEALRQTPREQVLLRLKGAPHADRTVETLFSDDAFDPVLARARAEVAALATKRVRVLAPGDAAWPRRLDALPRDQRPVVLYAFGDVDRLALPSLAVLAHAPIEGGAFESIQALARDALARGLPLVVGAAHGVDVALQKLAAGAGVPAVAVLGAGLARMERSLRPAATAVVRAGGTLVSPFPMSHGPFDHDDRERAVVQAALGSAVAVVPPPDASPEDRAARWAAEAGRPLAVVGTGRAAWADAALPVLGPADHDAALALAG